MPFFSGSKSIRSLLFRRRPQGTGLAAHGTTMRTKTIGLAFLAATCFVLTGCGANESAKGDSGAGQDGASGGTSGQAGVTATTGGGTTGTSGKAGNTGGGGGIGGGGGSAGTSAIDGGASDAIQGCDANPQDIDVDCAYGTPISWYCVRTNTGEVLWIVNCPVPPEDGGGVDGRSDAGSDRPGDSIDASAEAPGPDAAPDGKICTGPNPANQCRQSANDCIPSTCACSNGVWACTADCSTNKAICPDAGTDKTDSRSSTIPCGNTLCSAGQYCCNLNCSICAPTGAVCVNLACQPPSTWACRDDSDCTLMDDYCTGCDCRALGPKGTLAACSGSGVQCLVAPCANKVALCKEGQCVAGSKTITN